MRTLTIFCTIILFVIGCQQPAQQVITMDEPAPPIIEKVHAITAHKNTNTEIHCCQTFSEEYLLQTPEGKKLFFKALPPSDCIKEHVYNDEYCEVTCEEIPYFLIGYCDEENTAILCMEDSVVYHLDLKITNSNHHSPQKDSILILRKHKI